MKRQQTFPKMLPLLLVLSLLVLSSLSTSFNLGMINSSERTNAHILSLQQFQPTTNQIKEFQIPTNNSGPLAIFAAPNETFWFTEFNSGKIGEFFATNSSFNEFQIPENGAKPASLAIDSYGRVWFSDQSSPGSVWMFDPSNGKFTQYKTLTPNSAPLFVLIDSQNNVWFAESTSNKLGELIYPNYNMVEYTLPTANSQPVELAFGQNESIIWITETHSGKIAEFNAVTHAFLEFSPPAAASLGSPVGIVYDQRSGNVWVSDHGGSAVEELIPSNSTFRKFPTSVPPPSVGYANSAVATLAIDSQGRLWFVEHFANKVGRLDPATGTMNEFLIPTPGAYSVQNALDANGNFWFTEFTANDIGVISSNASSPIVMHVVNAQTSPVVAGQTTTENLIVTNELPTQTVVQLNATSTFSETGQTPEQEVSLNVTSLDLGPGGSAVVKASITPESSLSTGVYSVGIVATYGNDSSIGIAFVPVSGSFSILGFIASNMQTILVIIVVLLVATYFIARRRGAFGKRSKDKT